MIKAIAIDDEPGSLDIIKSHVNKTTEVTLVEVFTNPITALEYVNNKHVDLIFLDIEMPDISGLDFAKAIKRNTVLIVFITAHSEYAVSSYDLEAVDYLLKPFDLPRFLISVRRVKEALDKQPVHNQEYLFVNTGSEVRKIWLAEILFIEGEGNYVTYHTDTERILVRSSIKTALKSLSPGMFIQIHRSYIISLKKLVKIQDNHAFIGNVKLSIGSNFREAFMRSLN